MTLFALDNLTVSYGRAVVVHGLSFELERGSSLAIVGESGAGKSQAMLAALGLASPTARVSGSARFDGRELVGMPRDELDQIRGVRIAMVFQDPMTALNPYLRVGTQVAEMLSLHLGVHGNAARARVVTLFERVRLDDPAACFDAYPHELSGGMRQRVMIAMAIACEPDLLVLDEPTTALDATIQAQLLALLREIRASTGIATILITHDLGIVVDQCERILVMYAGRVVESGPVDAVFTAPRHPYTAALIDALPRIGTDERLVAIPGQPPVPGEPAPGCAFAPRCTHAFKPCHSEAPADTDGVACHLFK